jgi:hypothetical protein
MVQVLVVMYMYYPHGQGFRSPTRTRTRDNRLVATGLRWSHSETAGREKQIPFIITTSKNTDFVSFSRPDYSFILDVDLDNCDHSKWARFNQMWAWSKIHTPPSLKWRQLLLQYSHCGFFQDSFPSMLVIKPRLWIFRHCRCDSCCTIVACFIYGCTYRFKVGAVTFWNS